MKFGRINLHVQIPKRFLKNVQGDIGNRSFICLEYIYIFLELSLPPGFNLCKQAEPPSIERISPQPQPPPLQPRGYACKFRRCRKHRTTY